MSESNQPQHNDTDDSLLVEISDLRTGEDEPARPLTPKRLTTRQRLRRMLGAALAVALALLAIIISVRGFALPNLFERQPPRPIALSVSSADMSFLEDMAWSPDGRRIALLGCLSDEVGPCEDSRHYIPNVVLIYDAASGKLVTRIHPDAPVLTELHTLDPIDVPALPPTRSGSQPPVLVNVHVLSFQLLWSPDGRRLALLFQADVPVPSRQGQNNYWDGVVLVNSDGTHLRALFDPNPAVGGSIWNPVTGILLHAASLSPHVAMLPHALAYHWGADDMLLPDTPLMPGVVPPAPPLGPVGNPDGGPRFTVWQPGIVTPILNNDPTAPPAKPSAYAFYASFVAWSPDGIQLVTPPAFAFAYNAPVLVPAGQRPPSLPAQYSGMGQPSQPSFLPVRDKALQHLLDLGPLPNIAESGWDVAWRPDGRVLAAYGVSTTPDSPHPITLYDCATGRELAALQPPTGTLVPDGVNGGILRWSPDGAHLLAYIQRTSLTIWGPGLLPS